MEILDQLKYARALVVLQKRFESFDLTLEMGRNFKHFRALVDALDDRDLSDQFNLAHEKLLPTNSFWVVLRDRAEAVIGVLAAKFDDIGPRALSDHWQVDQPRMYRENAGGLIEFEAVQSRAARAISGRVAYVGDLWVRKDRRKTGVSGDLSKLVQVIALQIWQPDTIYAFVHNVGVTRGLAAHFGFCHQYPVGIRWRSNPRQLLPDNWLVCNHRPDLLDLIDLLADSPE